MEIIGSFILAILHSILFYGNEIGISMLIFSVIGNGLIFYIFKKKSKIKNKNGFFIMIPIILLSSSYFVFANTTFAIINIFALIILEIIMIAIIRNEKDYFKNYFYDSFKITIDTIVNYENGIDVIKKESNKYIKENNKVNKDNVKKITTSVLIVLVIVGVIIALLASADSIFAGIFSGFGNIFGNININNTFSIIFRMIIVIAISLLFLSFTFTIQKEFNKDKKELKIETDKYSFTIKLLLVVLNIVYLVFCYIQIKTLFAKINLDEAFDYANYARTGFFQLMFVSLINFAIILISDKYTENKEKYVKILNLFLIVFTIIIALSSMYRMYMYEMEYGLTYLRMFVYIILLTELAIFVPTTIYIFNKKIDFIKWSFIIILCVYCGINFINIEKLIVNKNINRDTQMPIDYEYISYIANGDSYDVLEERLEKDNLTPVEQLEIKRILLNIVTEINEDMNWQEFNISKWKVKEKNIDIQKLKDEVEELEYKYKEEKEVLEKKSKKSENYIYNEVINKNEEYFVKEIDSATGNALWEIGKITDNGSKYTVMNKIAVTSPSKIKFFDNGLGFLERPTSIYCGKSELLVTHDSGKTFEVINFPNGEFNLSDPNGEEWKNCYDYFYLPTITNDGTLIVLASGGYEGGYNQGKTRAKYISIDNGYTWQFVEEIFK